jgi:hypothetical protein
MVTQLQKENQKMICINKKCSCGVVIIATREKFRKGVVCPKCKTKMRLKENTR